MTYTLEIEFKYTPKDPAPALAWLAQHGILVQPRTLFRAVGYRREDNTSFHSMDILRLRQEGSVTYLTCKQRYQDNIRLEHALEAETRIENMEFFQHLFHNLGLVVSAESEKYRTTWRVGDCEVMYDENPGIDGYFEIEGPSHESLEKVSDAMNITGDLRGDVSGRELYREKYGERGYYFKKTLFSEELS